MLGRDLRILAAHFLEHTLPQSSRVGHGIRLITHEDALARTAVLLLVTFAVFEGVTNHSLYAFAGVDVFLHCDLVRRALLEYAAGVNVDALGVFAHHDKINVDGFDSFQRTQRCVQQAHRAHVGIQVHLEAHAQQNFFGVDIRGHARVAESTQQDGVKIAFQHSEAFGRDGDTVSQVAIGAPVEMG